jgi:cyanophycinase-like exopeptidase
MTTTQGGTTALVGAGEFLETMLPVDSYLVERMRERGEEPRVAIVPTASAPDGGEVPQRWAKMGVEHFARLGLTAQPVMLLTRQDAEDAQIAAQLAEANFVYFSGGKPRYLMETLHASAAWQAILGMFQRGGTIAGCSAGAMVLGEALFDFPQFWHTTPALSLVPGIMVIPHFDEIPKMLKNTMVSAGRKQVVVGIDGGTALVISNGRWLVQGKGGVTVFNGRQKQRYTAGETIALEHM